MSRFVSKVEINAFTDINDPEADTTLIQRFESMEEMMDYQEALGSEGIFKMGRRKVAEAKAAAEAAFKPK